MSEPTLARGEKLMFSTPKGYVTIRGKTRFILRAHLYDGTVAQEMELALHVMGVLTALFEYQFTGVVRTREDHKAP